MDGTELAMDPPTKRERAKSVGPRLIRAIEALVTGEAKTIKDAAAGAQLTRVGLSRALGKPHVRQFMQGRIQEVLRVGAAVAGQRMVELMHSDNAQTCYNASKFLLATGAGITPPEQSAPLVQIGIGSVGYVIDTSRRRGAQGNPTGAVTSEMSEAGGVVRSLPAVIDADASAVKTPGVVRPPRSRV